MAESDGELDYNQLVTSQNRKQKRSGGFQSLGLDATVLKGITKRGYKIPTPIQRKAIPIILSGKDAVAMARTGSGKTAAFLIPLLQKLKRRSLTGTRALLISPTRELALQTFTFLKEIGKFTGLRGAVLVGGELLEDQFEALHTNPDVVIATPGRLLHVVVEMNLKLTHVEYVVFDEADRLFEMGFEDQLREVLKRLPLERQTLLFSATLPKMLVEFARAGLADPTLVRLDTDTKLPEKLKNNFICCRTDDKLSILLHMLNNMISGEESTIIFCATKHYVEYVKDILAFAGLPCSYLYSSLDPEARNLNINAFRSGDTKVLVVTDLAARGVDIPLLDNVINLHFPSKSKLYVHRVGRTARSGQSGTAYSLIGTDETAYLIDMFLFLGKPMNIIDGSSDSNADASHDKVGSCPGGLLDTSSEALRSWLENNPDLDKQRVTAENSMKQYIKSRPAASSESTRRSKKEDWNRMGTHPVFGDSRNSMLPTTSVLHSLKNFKPKMTIFEAHKGNKDTAYNVMKDKRRVHKLVGKQVEQTMDADKPTTSMIDVPEATDDVIQETFSEIHVSAKYRPSEKLTRRAAGKDEMPETTDAEYFIPYRPKDFHSEQGLSVSERSSFDHASRNATLELTGDEVADMRVKNRQKQIWDRKRKKFVSNPENDGRVKKIRTESGVMIPATYRSGAYDKWKKQQNIDDRTEDATGEEGQQQGPDGLSRMPGGGRMRGRKGRKASYRIQAQAAKQAGRGPRSELKSSQEILKVRRKKVKQEHFERSRKDAKASKKGGGPGGGGFSKQKSFRGKR